MSRRAEPLRIAIVCSGHGYGHVTRQLAIAAALKRPGVEPTVLTTMPPLMAARLAPGVAVRSWEADVGFVQSGATTEDVPATLARLDEVCSPDRIDALADALAPFDGVVADVPPPALEAARRIGKPAIAVGSFDWAWAYGHYPDLEAWSETFAQWQQPVPAVSLWPGPGMRGFRRVTEAGLVGLQAAAAELPHPAVLVSFGRWGFRDLADALPRMAGVTWISDDPDTLAARDDVVWVPGATYPSLVAGSDVVLTKPGYGIAAEAMLAGTRLAWFERGSSPEGPFLEAVLRERGDPRVSVRLDAPVGLAGAIEAAVAEALAAGPPEAGPQSDAPAVAGMILDQLADGSSGKSP